MPAILPERRSFLRKPSLMWRRLPAAKNGRSQHPARRGRPFRVSGPSIRGAAATQSARAVRREPGLPRVMPRERHRFFERPRDSSKVESKLGAFLLHYQSTETLYPCLSLVRALYTHKAHNLNPLRGRCRGHGAERQTGVARRDRRREARFLLRDGHIKARHSREYHIIGGLKACRETRLEFRRLARLETREQAALRRDGTSVANWVGMEAPLNIRRSGL